MNDRQHAAVLRVENAKVNERRAAGEYDAATRKRKRAEAELRKEIRLDETAWNEITTVKDVG